MHTLTTPWGETSARPRLVTVLTGTVVSRGEKVTGDGSVFNGQGGMTVTSIPCVWLRDDGGREHQFEDFVLRHTREGHRIAVFHERFGKQRMVAMANLTTGQSWGTPWRADDATPGNILVVGLLLAIALAIPGLVLWAWFVGAVTGINLSQAGIPDWYWSGWMILVGSGALLLSWKILRGVDHRRRVLRAEIERATENLRAQASESVVTVTSRTC